MYLRTDLDYADHKHYSGDTFSCRQSGGWFKSAKTIPISWVNDDYCDCEDGSDEPGTAACYNGHFYCANQGSRGKSVPSSWVNDGICDCCDGSDEWLSKSTDELVQLPNKAINCPNTCAAEAEARASLLRGVLSEAEEGMRVRSEWIESYRAQQTENQRKLSALSAEHKSLEQRVTDLTAKHAQADSEYQAKRALVEPELQTAVESEMGAETASESSEEVPADETDDERVHRLARAQIDGQRDRENKVKQLVEERVNQHESVQSSKLEKDQAEEALNAAKKERDRVKSEMDELTKFSELDLGHHGEFFGLYKSTLEFRNKEYIYEVKPWEKATQRGVSGHSSTNLGKWDNFESEYQVMKFANGDRCWNGPARSLRVEMQCGRANELTLVDEPAKCEYRAVLKTPALCSETYLEQLRSGL
jgi:protein kinase C substrate 80K-H